MTFNQPQQVFRNFKVATLAQPGTLLTPPSSDGAGLLQPAAAYGLLENSVIGVGDGKILWIMPESDVPAFSGAVETVDGQGRLLTPGLIDCHTHLVYGGNRAIEWEKRLTGVSYEQIAREGGGILSTVRDTRMATEQQLVESALPRLKTLMKQGVTTVEIKSGYGLDLATELKMLRVARQLENEADISVVTTLLAAHAVPPEFQGRTDDYIDLVCNEIIPAAAEFCSSVDAFCESIAFNLVQTIRVFEAAKENGLDIKVHAEQLTRTGIAAVAAEMGALSADHLEYLSNADCDVLASHQTVATVLPGAFYCLNETQKPPIESLRHNRVPIAVATDSNPGSSPVTSILLMGNMACNLFGLTPEESLAAITINAAKALRLDQRVGSLQPHRRADFAVWNVETPAQILYGIGHNPCVEVYRAGRRRLIEP